MTTDCLQDEVMSATSVDQWLEEDSSGSYYKHLAFQVIKPFQFLEKTNIKKSKKDQFLSH